MGAAIFFNTQKHDVTHKKTWRQHIIKTRGTTLLIKGFYHYQSQIIVVSHFLKLIQNLQTQNLNEVANLGELEQQTKEKRKRKNSYNQGRLWDLRAGGAMPEKGHIFTAKGHFFFVLHCPPCPPWLRAGGPCAPPDRPSTASLVTTQSLYMLNVWCKGFKKCDSQAQ